MGNRGSSEGLSSNFHPSVPDSSPKQWGPLKRRIGLATLFDFQSSPRGSFRIVETPQGDAYIGPVGPRNRPSGGNGVILYNDGSAFVGRMENGRRNGYGTFIHSATDVQYDGEWKDDYWHGRGCLYSVHDRTVLKGEWDCGELRDYGLRVDLNTGLSWRERYEDGRLMSQHLLNVETGYSSSSDSSSLRTTDASHEKLCQPAIRSISDQPISCGASGIPVVASDLVRRRPIIPCDLVESETALVGSPSFVKYTQGAANLLGRSLHQSSTSGEFGTTADPGAVTRSRFVLAEDGASSAESVADWSTEKVCNWLRTTVQFEENIVKLFETARVDGAKLLGLTRVNLKTEIGLFPFGYQMKILEQIRRLRARETNNASTDLQPVKKTHEDYIIPPEQLEFVKLLGCDQNFFSATYLGSWLGRTVAIKVYTGLLVNEDFWTEYVQTILTVRHPNLILVLGVSYLNPVVRCVVMEFAARGCLASCLYGNQVSDLCDSWRRQDLDHFDAENRGDVTLSLATAAKMVGHLALGGAKAGNLLYQSARATDDTGSCIPMDRLSQAYHDDDDLVSLAVGGRQGTTAESTTAAALGVETCAHIHHYLGYLVRPPNDTDDRDSRHNRAGSPRKRSHALHQSLAITLAKGIVIGLIYLHRKKIYHLNLKPTNVLISGDWQPKLTDFGQKDFSKAFTNFPLFASVSRNRPTPVVCPHCAKVLNPSHCGFSDGPEVEATANRPRRLNWCAPEVLRLPLQFRGRSPESDVYSFGLLFSSMITNDIPCAGLSPTQIRIAVGYAKFRPHNVYLPLERLVGSCTAFDPIARASWTTITNELFDLKRSAGSSAEDALVAFMQGSVPTS